MSPNQFGEAPGSIARTINLPGSDPELARLMWLNQKEYRQILAEYEAWAKAGFVTGFSVSSLSGQGENDAV